MRRSDGFSSAGVPPAPCFFMELLHRRQDAGATSPCRRIVPAKIPARSPSTRTALSFELRHYPVGRYFPLRERSHCRARAQTVLRSRLARERDSNRCQNLPWWAVDRATGLGQEGFHLGAGENGSDRTALPI